MAEGQEEKGRRQPCPDKVCEKCHTGKHNQTCNGEHAKECNECHKHARNEPAHQVCAKRPRKKCVKGKVCNESGEEIKAQWEEDGMGGKRCQGKRESEEGKRRVPEHEGNQRRGQRP